MSDKLFAACCLGSPTQHAEWEPCPLEEARIAHTEANVFAAYLLMPDYLFNAWIEKNPVCIEDDKWVDRCAKKFRVPLGLVIFRLTLRADEERDESTLKSADAAIHHTCARARNLRKLG
jgi:Zn-dependent peptidase ImmA (M78 family)